MMDEIGIGRALGLADQALVGRDQWASKPFGQSEIEAIVNRMLDLETNAEGTLMHHRTGDEIELTLVNGGGYEFRLLGFQLTTKGLFPGDIGYPSLF